MKNEKNKDTNKGCCIIIPFTNFQSWNYQACVADSAEIWPHCPPLEQLGPDVKISEEKGLSVICTWLIEINVIPQGFYTDTDINM